MPGASWTTVIVKRPQTGSAELQHHVERRLRHESTAYLEARAHRMAVTHFHTDPWHAGWCHCRPNEKLRALRLLVHHVQPESSLGSIDDAPLLGALSRSGSGDHDRDGIARAAQPGPSLVPLSEHGRRALLDIDCGEIGSWCGFALA